MGARDEYPIERTGYGVRYEIDPAMWKDMCDEIDRLRQRMAAYERWRDSLSVAMSNLGYAVNGLTPTD